MSTQDSEDYKQHVQSIGTLSNRERLIALRHELLRPVSIVNGYAAVLSKLLNENQATGELLGIVDKLTKASTELEEILDLYTRNLPQE